MRTRQTSSDYCSLCCLDMSRRRDPFTMPLMPHRFDLASHSLRYLTWYANCSRLYRLVFAVAAKDRNSRTFIDHPRSGMVHNFGFIRLSVCLSVCLYVCLSDDNFRKPWRRSVHLEQIWGHFRIWRSSGQGQGQGHRSKKKVKNPYSCKAACTTSVGNNCVSITHTVVQHMGFLDTADRMVWPPSLSRDRKWQRVKQLNARIRGWSVVGLRLEGTLVVRSVVRPS